VTYLLDANVLIALGVATHEFHERVELWVAALESPTDRVATCAITELAFVRILPQLPGLGATVSQAKQLLRRLKRQRVVRMELLEDAIGAEQLPPWVKAARQTTDGHLLQLAKRHAATLATLDDGIPEAFLVPA